MENYFPRNFYQVWDSYIQRGEEYLTITLRTTSSILLHSTQRKQTPPSTRKGRTMFFTKISLFSQFILQLLSFCQFFNFLKRFLEHFFAGNFFYFMLQFKILNICPKLYPNLCVIKKNYFMGSS